MKSIVLIISCFLFFVPELYSQTDSSFWNYKTNLNPRRLPLPSNLKAIERIDLDQDGDPDVIKYSILDSIPVMWVDDDDDMKWEDIEGDMDSDCLFIDKNKDGEFAGAWDLSIDRNDENGNQKPDMEFVIENGNPESRKGFDWWSNLMMVIDDGEEDGIFNYIDWNLMLMRPWEHNGHSNFFTDYHGNTLFTKMCVSSYRMYDFRFSWENPFLFWDFDDDGLSEMALRMLDVPHFRSDGKDSLFNQVGDEKDVIFSEIINYVAVTYDLDNDNGQGNEFDFDFSLCFEGDGFNYSDQVNQYKSMRGLPDADTLLFDSSWRELTELVYPSRENALDLTFNRGSWNQCRFVFDEDDDCNRWERVEFYDPKKLFVTGSRNGGLDTNGQADAIGDRGEFDMDFSGKGNLYIGAFDGRIHLHGAEWGAWRIDQTAFSFQGFGGLYDLWKGRLQKMPEKFATVKYTDTNENGFIDLIEYDLNGDTIFEQTISLIQLGLEDKREVVQTSKLSYSDKQTLFKKITEDNWERAQKVIEIAKDFGLNTQWYSFWESPRTLHEKYEYAYWLNFYLYQDLRNLAKNKSDGDLINDINKAYYSGNWELLKKINQK